MKQYSILIHPVKGIKVIRNGPCFPALYFGFFWLFYKKLHLQGFFLSLSFLMCIYFNFFLVNKLVFFQNYLQFLFYFSILLFPFFYGNTWLINKSVDSGYKFHKLISAQNKNIALELAKSTEVGWITWQDIKSK